MRPVKKTVVGCGVAAVPMIRKLHGELGIAADSLIKEAPPQHA
jgi:hypothetical protein